LKVEEILLVRRTKRRVNRLPRHCEGRKARGNPEGALAPLRAHWKSHGATRLAMTRLKANAWDFPSTFNCFRQRDMIDMRAT
jgi:hypothetical protein